MVVAAQNEMPHGSAIGFLDRQLESFEVVGADIVDLAGALCRETGVKFGVVAYQPRTVHHGINLNREFHPEPPAKEASLSRERNTLEQILNAAMEEFSTTESRYEWRLRDETVIIAPSSFWDESDHPLFHKVDSFVWNGYITHAVDELSRLTGEKLTTLLLDVRPTAADMAKARESEEELKRLFDRLEVTRYSGSLANRDVMQILGFLIKPSKGLVWIYMDDGCVIFWDSRLPDFRLNSRVRGVASQRIVTALEEEGLIEWERLDAKGAAPPAAGIAVQAVVAKRRDDELKERAADWPVWGFLVIGVVVAIGAAGMWLLLRRRAA